MSRARSSTFGLTAAIVCATTLACNSTPPAENATPAAGSPSAMRAVASVDQVMDGIIIPSSQKVFDAVIYVNGELQQAPKRATC